MDGVEFTDVGQSMRGGGGPACLRLRVVLTDEHLCSLAGNILLSDDLYDQLRATISTFYPEAVSFAQLADPDFCTRCRLAIKEIYKVLGFAC